MVVPYASLALATTQPAPILPWEQDGAGNVLPESKDKLEMTCWEAQHGVRHLKGLSGRSDPFVITLTEQGIPCFLQLALVSS